jgi:hypothetical protein
MSNKAYWQTMGSEGTSIAPAELRDEITEAERQAAEDTLAAVAKRIRDAKEAGK